MGRHNGCSSDLALVPLDEPERRKTKPQKAPHVRNQELPVPLVSTHPGALLPLAPSISATASQSRDAREPLPGPQQPHPRGSKTEHLNQFAVSEQSTFTLPRLHGSPGRISPSAYGSPLYNSPPCNAPLDGSLEQAIFKPQHRGNYDGANPAAMVAAKFAAGYRGMTLGEEDSVLSLQVSSVTVDGRPSRLAGIPGKGRKMFEKDVGLGAFESVVGHMFDPVAELIRATEADVSHLPPPNTHGINRKSLLLKIPAVADAFPNVDIPAVVEDRCGHTCLIILPSDKPSSRGEALAVEMLLAEALKDPQQAIYRAAAWRIQALQTMCSDAVTTILGAQHGSKGQASRSVGQAWALKASSSRPDASGRQLGGNNVVDLLSGQDDAASVLDAKGPVERMRAFERSSSQSDSGADHSEPPFRMRQRKSVPCLTVDDGQGGGATFSRLSVESQSKGHNFDAKMQQQQHQATLNSRSIAAASSICMADLIRQVEVHCGERGRALAYTWNAYLTTHEDSLLHLRKENDALTLASSRLKEQVEMLSQQVEPVEYLRREIQRFRKEAEVSQFEQDKLLRETLAMRQHVEEATAALTQLEIDTHRQLARLRWQYAYHTLGCRDKKFYLISGGLGRAGNPSTISKKIVMVERLKTAVLATEKRKLMYGAKRRAEDYAHEASFSEVVKSALSKHAQWRWTAGMGNDSADDLLRTLHALQPEAQVLVLFNAPEEVRQEVFKKLKPLQRAQLMVIMSKEMRQGMRTALGDEGWHETIEAAASNPELAAKMLHNVEMYEAVLQFSNWTTDKQLQVLAAMGASNAWGVGAQVIRRLPANMRKRILHRLDPGSAAQFLQVLDPAEYIADCLEGVSALQKARILQAMSPDRAAAALMHMSPHELAQEAAELLMYIEDEATRTAILEFMAPKTASEVLLAMDELAPDLAAKKLKARKQLAMEQGEEAVAALEAELEAAQEAEKQAAEVEAGRGDGSEGAGDDAAAEGNEGQGKGGTQADGTHRHPSLEGAAADTLLSMASGAAGSILGHMGFKDKAAILSSLDPSKVAEILALMSPADAVTLLAAMNDTSMTVVIDALTPEERAKMMKLLKVADKKANELAKCVPKKGKRGKKGVTLNEPRREELEEAYDTALDQLLGDDDGESTLMSEDAGPLSRSSTLHDRMSVNGGGRGKSNSGSGMTGHKVSEAGGGRTLGAGGSNGAQGSEDGEQGGDQPVQKGGRRKNAAGGDGGAGNDNDYDDEDGEDEGDGDAGAGGASMRRKGKGKRGAAGGGGAAGDEPADGDGDEEDGSDEMDEALLAELQRSPLMGAKPARGGGRGGRGRGGPSRSRAAVGGGASASEKVGIVLDDAKKVSAAAKALKAGLKNTPEGREAIKAAKARLEAQQAAQEAWELAMEEQAAGAAANEPQGKLGKLPKNQRLKDAMAAHKDAKPKPKGWLMSVVESVYKDGDAMLKKMGRAETLRKLSVPEIVFAYFHNKYGQKNVVEAYVGALVNTLTLYKSEDTRLDLFARFLSEEFDFSTFLAFLQAQALVQGPSRVPCIEYPKDAARDEPYAWSCFHKCVWVADTVIGSRSKNVRDRFNDLLLQASQQVEDSEVEKLRRDKRYEGEVIPDRMFKLHRIRFLLMVSKEAQRINTFIQKMAEDKFTRLDLQRTGTLPTSAVGGYLAQMVSPLTPPHTLAEVERAFIAFAAAMDQDVAAENVTVEEVKMLQREHFVQASIEDATIRDHVKNSLLPPPRLEDDRDDGQAFKVYLGSVVHRHMQALMPHFRRWLTEAGKDVLLQDQVMAVGREREGDAKFKAYLNLLASIVNVQVSGVIEGVLEGMSSDTMDSGQVETWVSRVEDVVVLLLQPRARFIVSTEPVVMMDRIRRLPPSLRLRDLGATCKAARSFEDSVHLAAAYVLQSVWRYRKAKLGVANRVQDQQMEAASEGGAVRTVVAEAGAHGGVGGARNAPHGGEPASAGAVLKGGGGPSHGLHVQLGDGFGLGGGEPLSLSVGSPGPRGVMPPTFNRSSSRRHVMRQSSFMQPRSASQVPHPPL